MADTSSSRIRAAVLAALVALVAVLGWVAFVQEPRMEPDTDLEMPSGAEAADQ